MKDITLIYPHQLFERHPAVKKNRHIALIEDSIFFGDRKYIRRFHRHKLIFHRCTLKMYERLLKSKGFTVTYIEYDRKRSSEGVIEALMRNGYDEFQYNKDTRIIVMLP